MTTTACSSDDNRAEEQTDNAVRKGEQILLNPMSVKGLMNLLIPLLSYNLFRAQRYTEKLKKQSLSA